jgi:hypothetical protein
MTEKQIEFGVQLVPEKKFNDYFARLQLRSEPAQPGFVFVRRNSKRELIAKLFGKFFPQPKSSLVVDRLVCVN